MLHPVYHLDLWFMCSAIDWKNTSYFFLFFLCFTSCPWNIEILKGREGQGMGLVGKGVHCPTAAPEIIKRRGTIIKMFAAVFGKLPRHGLISASTHNTHTHIPYSTYTHTTYRHLYICVWPGTFAHLLLLLGRLINWLLKVLKIENKILRYQNKIPARVRGRGGSASQHPHPQLCPCAW